MKKRWIYLTLTFAIIILLGQTNGRILRAEPEEPSAPESSAPNWEAAEKISQSSGITGAILPSIAASENSAKVIVVYSGVLNNDNANHDVYYATSTNFGDTWPTKARIHQSSGTSSDSNFIDVALTPNNKGHAVWAEEVSDVPRIVYKYEDNWGNNTTNLVTVSAQRYQSLFQNQKL